MNAGSMALRCRYECAPVGARIAKPARVSIEDDVDAKSHAAA